MEMNHAAAWAVGAGHKFREVARTTENPTTKLLAEGLTQLSEAIRALQPGDFGPEDSVPEHPEAPPF